MNWRTWLLPTGTALIGLIIGLWINQQSVPLSASVERSVTTSDAPTAAVPTNAKCTEVTVASLADVRLSIHEELAASVTSIKATGNVVADKHSDHDDTSSDGKPVTPPNATQLVTASHAQSVIDAAISHRQWTERDAEQLRGEFDSLTTEQRAELLQKFTVAINKGQLIPQTDRIPF